MARFFWIAALLLGIFAGAIGEIRVEVEPWSRSKDIDEALCMKLQGKLLDRLKDTNLVFITSNGMGIGRDFVLRQGISNRNSMHYSLEILDSGKSGRVFRMECDHADENLVLSRIASDIKKNLVITAGQGQFIPITPVLTEIPYFEPDANLYTNWITRSRMDAYGFYTGAYSLAGVFGVLGLINIGIQFFVPEEYKTNFTLGTFLFGFFTVLELSIAIPNHITYSAGNFNYRISF